MKAYGFFDNARTAVVQRKRPSRRKKICSVFLVSLPDVSTKVKNG